MASWLFRHQNTSTERSDWRPSPVAAGETSSKRPRTSHRKRGEIHGLMNENYFYTDSDHPSKMKVLKTFIYLSAFYSIPPFNLFVSNCMLNPFILNNLRSYNNLRYFCNSVTHEGLLLIHSWCFHAESQQLLDVATDEWRVDHGWMRSTTSASSSHESSNSLSRSWKNQRFNETRCRWHRTFQKKMVSWSWGSRVFIEIWV